MKIEIGDKEGQLNAYINMADIYALKKQYQNALTCCFKAVKIAEEINDLDEKALAFINIGGTLCESK
jgi:tetratricopeptide (TPR) repeat protein